MSTPAPTPDDPSPLVYATTVDRDRTTAALRHLASLIREDIDPPEDEWDKGYALGLGQAAGSIEALAEAIGGVMADDELAGQS